MCENRRFQIEEKIENESGFALILNKRDFDIFVKEFRLPVFYSELRDMTVYNGALIGRSTRFEDKD